ncbi:MAG TPA: GntR family transcriptional regulator [Solirubrobacter sp.]|nr:GntR family transcriptional regulator [Solirubrobacter sp.]
MPVPDTLSPFERELLRDRAYARLRDAIVDGTLAPGERLRDQDLCAWLGLSRTPVREALARLEQDGLVETAPQRFTRVAPIERRAAADAFPIVAAVHALAAELAVPRVALDPLQAANQRFAAALERSDVDAALAADDDFHGVFVTASGNAELPRVLARLMPGVRRLERLRFGSLAGRDSVRQHEEIIEAARGRDAAATAARVRENWLSLGALLDQTFEEDAA